MIEFLAIYSTFDSVFGTKRPLNVTRRRNIEKFFHNYKIESNKVHMEIESVHGDFYCKIEEFGYFVRMRVNDCEKFEVINFLNNTLNFNNITEEDSYEVAIISKLSTGEYENPLEQTNILKKVIKSESEELLVEYSYIDKVSDNGILVKNTFKLLAEHISVTTSTVALQGDKAVHHINEMKEYVNNTLKMIILESLEV